jgi:hypothetical protein
MGGRCCWNSTPSTDGDGLAGGELDGGGNTANCVGNTTVGAVGVGVGVGVVVGVDVGDGDAHALPPIHVAIVFDANARSG